MDMAFLEQARTLVREIGLRFGAGPAAGLREHGVDDGAASVLSSLDRAQRDQLVAAMADVSRLLRTSAVRIDPESAVSAEAQWCMEAYFEELGRRFDAGFDPAASNPADADLLRPPTGAFIIARLDGQAIGCGALKTIDGGPHGAAMAEIKRMWVSADARGLGVGRRIIEALEAQARALGVVLLRLETNRNLTEAIALYRKAGFQEVAAFNDEPYAHHWFEKALTWPGT